MTSRLMYAVRFCGFGFFMACMACGTGSLVEVPRLPEPPFSPAEQIISHEQLVMPSDPEVPIEEALADGFETRHLLRTHILSTSKAFWVRGGESMTISSDHDNEGPRIRHRMVVLERHPESVRVILDFGDVRLAAYFPLDSLQPTPDSPVKLIQPGVNPRSGEGVMVFPSINGRFRRRRNGFWEFSRDIMGVQFTGRLPASRVTWVYNQNDVGTEVTEETHLIKNGTVIRVEPEGAEVARIRDPGGSDWILGGSVLKRQGGHALVVLEHREFRIQGWVSQTGLKKLDGSHGMGGFGYGMTGGWGSSRQRMVEAGTRLYACPGGPQVGIVLKRTNFGDDGVLENGFYSLYRNEFPLGFMYSVCMKGPDSSSFIQP